MKLIEADMENRPTQKKLVVIEDPSKGFSYLNENQSNCWEICLSFWKQGEKTQLMMDLRQIFLSLSTPQKSKRSRTHMAYAALPFSSSMEKQRQHFFLVASGLSEAAKHLVLLQSCALIPNPVAQV